MILRKPYALLIKNFKLIHAIMTVLMIYVFYKTLNVLYVFSGYLSSDMVLLDENTASNTFNLLMFIFPIFIIILSLILLTVMFVKKKPSSLYLISIVTYIYVFVMMSISKNTIITLEVSLLDIRTIKLIRDLTTVSLMLQFIPLIKSFVRTVGFDIKQFDFGKDLAELDINEKDNEEFEVSISFDINKLKRDFNASKRRFKYVYVENRFLVNTVATVVIIIVGSLITYGFLKSGKVVGLNTSFKAGSFNFSVLNVYSTREDYKGNTLPGLADNKSIIVVQTSIKNNTDKNKQFLTANVELDIGDHKFRNIDTYRDSITDLGDLYDGEDLPSKEKVYKIFVFEVPTSFLDNQMYIRFIDSIVIKNTDLIPTYVSVPLTPISLDSTNTHTIINKGEDLSLKDSILYDSTLNISSIDISKRFKVDYNFCITSSNCLASYEYLYAELNSNNDKSLMKVDGTINYSSRAYSLNYLYDLINDFGSLRYVIGTQTKTVSANLTKINPSYSRSNTTIYISVPREVENATSVSLIFNIRNKQYEYVIK